ncbi:Uncharacterized membrane protein [Proteiniborus ethanoligenes]|uniref:Uncharacterized membrane protein n=1 Tax=Proteiniborus ethanoligenes TaxID=415015 RepID=A0A1H3LKU3_9FIRM|nr:small multi-drug export protein [Proteiniborus ethanoligenes]SDY65021.1 Uncharacterized membrane protein [Proteiniborus ethanoligenes]
MGEILEFIKEEFIVMMIAAAPISELRGAIPLGISIGFSPLHSTIISIIGNCLPVPFLLLILRPLFAALEDVRIVGEFIKWIKRRTLRKSNNIVKYSVLGLYILVAIPLPTTGAYTGCVAATLFNIRFKYAILAIVSGVITSGIIVLFLSHQVTVIF